MSIDLTHPDFIRLRTEIKEKPKEFIIIIGAGLSVPAGLPNWSGLRNKLVEEGLNRISEIPEDEQEDYRNTLNNIKKIDNLWRAFSQLKKYLPPHAYETSIKESLTLSDNASIPITNELICKLNIRGIISFNLDTCVLDSYAKIRRSAAAHATSTEKTRYLSFNLDPNFFIFQPHGYISDSASWILTTDNRSKLYSDNDYTEFMKSLLRSYHCLILGFNTDDFSFQYLQQDILTLGKDFSSKKYIFLSHPKHGQIDELSNLGIRTIPYAPSDEVNHTEIESALQDILNFIPLDEVSPSVYSGEEISISDLPSPDDLMNKPVNEVRILLNGAISSIIPEGQTISDDDLTKLENFKNKYIRPLHDAWLVSPDTEFDTIHKYKIISHIGNGAFGYVYNATNISNKENVAIKILRDEVKDNRDYANSFRRGVRSMKILTDRNTPGMVKFIEAFEVPACIIMENVYGTTIENAVENQWINTIPICLEILIKIGHIIQSAHNLPESVLHRDIKPANAIIRNYFSEHDEIDIVVLDFDLSCYKGAEKLSVAHFARTQGYAAPEQVSSKLEKGVTTRSTAVDVYGFGMLAYYVFTGINPRPNEHRFGDFEKNIERAISDRFETNWIGSLKYLTETIKNCTLEHQKERISLSTALERLELCYSVFHDSCIPAHSFLLQLEIAYRLSINPNDITVDEEKNTICIEFIDASKSVDISLIEISGDLFLDVKVSKIRADGESRYVSKKIDKAKSKSISILKKSNMLSIKADIGTSLINILFKVPLSKQVSANEIDRVVDVISQVRAELEL